MKRYFIIAVLGCLGAAPSFAVPAAISYQPPIKIFPNPFNEELHLQIDTPSSIIILSVIGEIVYEQGLTEPSTIKLNLGHLPNGIYLIRTTSGNNVKTQRVVKK